MTFLNTPQDLQRVITTYCKTPIPAKACLLDREPPTRILFYAQQDPLCIDTPILTLEVQA